MDLPETLHGQLYLLAFDRKRHRFDGDNCWLFGFALRAAMLTDLHLSGHLEDKAGKPCPSSAARPDDPVLRAMFDKIGVGSQKDWAELIAEDDKDDKKGALALVRSTVTPPPLISDPSRVVRDQLEGTGWLRVQHRRMLGIIPTTRVALYDEDTVSGLAYRVTEALRNAIDGRPADPRPLAVGLLGVVGQMPTVFSFDECARHRQVLRELTYAAIEPILGLHQAIHTYLEDSRISNIDM